MEYYGKINVVRGNLMGLPGWARGVLFVIALPGILAVALSIALIVCSVAALLLVTVPIYSILRMLTQHSSGEALQGGQSVVEAPGRRHVDVKIIE